MSSESSEVGPPPALHLDDHARRLSEEQQADLDEARIETQLTGLLSANFETRKRRRETYVRPDEGRQTEEPHIEQPFLKTPERLQGKPIRASRKRRLSAQLSLEEVVAEPQEFVFTRKELHDPEKQTEPAQLERLIRQPDVLESKPDMDVFAAPRRLTSPSRLALTARTTNMSPKKTDPQMSTKDGKKRQIVEEKPRKAARQHQLEVPAPQPSILEPDVAEIDISNIKLEPKTPAFAALNSPTSTQPSELRTDSRDTPPPSDLSRSHYTAEGGAAARGSRRARTQVNYAEPSLISKMRRPTKELVAAVGKDARRSSSAEPTREGQQPVKIVTIKREQESGEWKLTTSSSSKELSRPEPTSPTQPTAEESAQSAVSGRLPRRDRRTSSGAAAEQAFSVLEDEELARNDLARRMEELEVFDVKTSSPVLPSIETEPVEGQPARQALKSRRQSLVQSRSTAGVAPATTKAIVGPAHQRALSIAGTDQAGKLVSVDRGGAARGRRRSMMG